MNQQRTQVTLTETVTPPCIESLSVCMQEVYVGVLMHGSNVQHARYGEGCADLHDLETNTRNVTDGVTLTTETGNKHLVLGTTTPQQSDWE